MNRITGACINLEFGIWNLEFGIWNLEFGIFVICQVLNLWQKSDLVQDLTLLYICVICLKIQDGGFL